MLAKAITKYTSTQVSAIAGRIYRIAPQSSATPYVVFRVVTDVPSHAFGDNSGYSVARVQFNICANSWASVETVCGQMESAYENYRAPLSTQKMAGEHWVQATAIQNRSDMPEKEGAQVRETILDISFYHQTT